MNLTSNILNRDDLVALTGKQRPTAQARTLNQLGIHFKVRPDGTLLVLVDLVRQAMGIDDPSKPTKRKKPEIRTAGLLNVRNEMRAA